MGNKVFISYKYSDSDVEQLGYTSILNPTTARDYVDIL